MSTYDAELPILAELEAALHTRAQALATPAPAPPAAPRAIAAARAAPAAPARPRRRIHAARVARRALVLVGVSGLVGASAFATRSLVGGGGDNGRGQDPSLRTTTAVELGAGGTHEAWTLSAARRGSDLCDAFIAGGGVATRCERPPGPTGVLLDGLVSPRARYVVGLAGPRVARVTVQADGDRRTIRTRAATDPAAARGTHLPRGLRWFVVTLARDAPGSPRRARVTVTARDDSGRTLTRRSFPVRSSLVNKQ